jgi:hypothetical protein
MMVWGWSSLVLHLPINNPYHPYPNTHQLRSLIDMIYNFADALLPEVESSNSPFTHDGHEGVGVGLEQ